jgi:1-phosphatidylinositol phosphodiesterase
MAPQQPAEITRDRADILAQQLFASMVPATHLQTGGDMLATIGRRTTFAIAMLGSTCAWPALAQATSLCLYNATATSLSLHLNHNGGAPQPLQLPKLSGYCDNGLSSSYRGTVTGLGPDGASLSVDQSASNLKLTSGPLPLSSDGSLSYRLISGNWTNSYTFYQPHKPVIDTRRWMGALEDGTRLNRIVMPGSHDAGMSQTDHCTFVVKAAWAKTQRLGALDQARAGWRYFDIRVDYDHGELVTFHRTYSLGCNGQPLGNGTHGVLDDAVAFVQQHPTETLILKFSHTRDDWGHPAADTVRRVVELLATAPYNAYLFKASGASINLAQLPVSQVRGKLIAVLDREYEQYRDPAGGLFSYADYPATTLQGLTVFDSYANTDDVGQMASDQIDKLAAHGGLGKDFVFLLSWTLTGKLGKQDIKQIANTRQR